MTNSQAAGFRFRVLAGTMGTAGYEEGSASKSRFSTPSALTADRRGRLYVADSLNHCIRVVDLEGGVTTLAGMVVDSDLDGINEGGAQDGPGPTARFNYPAGVALDAAGNTYVSDAWNHTIRMISSSGWVSTVAGQAGNYGHRDGQAAQALFDDPCGIAVDLSGSIYVAERGSSVIRKINRDGMVSTIAGSPWEQGSSDGQGADARFSRPSGLCVDSQGTLYLADSGNHTIRLITTNGLVKTVGGIPGVFGYSDGEASNSLFFEPMGVAADKDRQIYVADTFNNVIRRIRLDGQVETLRPFTSFPPRQGTGDLGVGEPDGPFFGPSGLVVSGGGILAIANAGNNIITSGEEVIEVGLRVSFRAGLPVLHVSGGAGRECTIESCSELGHDDAWTPLLQVRLTSDTVTLTDHTALGVPVRFYRVRPESQLK